MALRTTFTELLAVTHPIALAPMGGSAGGELAAAVSNGGGLGLVGGGRGDRDWLEQELAIVVERTDKPWGVGFLSWSATIEAVESALEYRPHAVMLSFGDPTRLAEPVMAAGVRLIVQVTDLDEAEAAVRLGADVIVAQGAEAGATGAGAQRCHSCPSWSTAPVPRRCWQQVALQTGVESPPPSRSEPPGLSWARDSRRPPRHSSQRR
jgi:nitronate monooxygenase